MNDVQKLENDYPWIQTPLVVGAPMRLIALADMAVEISKAGTHVFLYFSNHTQFQHHTFLGKKQSKKHNNTDHPT
jgi:hypothetical protein